MCSVLNLSCERRTCFLRNSLLTIMAHLVGMLISGFITFAALGINGHTDSDSINGENMTGIQEIIVDSSYLMFIST